MLLYAGIRCFTHVYVGISIFMWVNTVTCRLTQVLVSIRGYTPVCAGTRRYTQVYAGCSLKLLSLILVLVLAAFEKSPFALKAGDYGPVRRFPDACLTGAA